MSKRILIFSTAYLPLIGGAEVAVKEITDRIPDSEFVMITSKFDRSLAEREKVGNIEVHRLGLGNKWDKFRLILKGPRYAQNLGHFDVVWSIMASYAGFTALMYKNRNKAVPYLLTLQEGDSKLDVYKHVWWCWPYFKRIFKKANKIQAISNYLSKWAKDMGAKRSIEVVPNGVDLEKFSKNAISAKTGIQEQALNIKQSLGINDSGKIVVTISRLVKKNGVGDLVQAMKFLDENVHLLIIGEGVLKKELVVLENNLGLANRVHFLGNIFHDNLPKYLWASDVFCRPSLSEGLGNVFLEAMASGVPIVATNIGGIPDFLKNGETGLFCEVGNPKNISEKIKDIIHNESLKEKLVKNANKLVQEKYSWDLVANKMKNIFETI